jgi:hypothetical protein
MIGWRKTSQGKRCDDMAITLSLLTNGTSIQEERGEEFPF